MSTLKSHHVLSLELEKNQVFLEVFPISTG
jgi:hypothetical protein